MQFPEYYSYTRTPQVFEEVYTKNEAGEYVKINAGDSGPVTVSWDDVTEKPETFKPTIGTTADTAKAGDYSPSWDDISNKPATFTPTIGTTANTAMAGNTAIPIQYTDAMAQAAIKGKAEIAGLVSPTADYADITEATAAIKSIIDALKA